MKGVMNSFFMVLFLFAVSADSAEDWTQQNPSSAPSARYWHDMACITKFQAILFGGVASSLDDETWMYDLGDNTWTKKILTYEPSPRYGHAMAYIGNGKVLLFGGYDDSNDDETWYYDLDWDRWFRVQPLPDPSPRAFHAMAYIGDDKVLLFGGDDGSLDDETWVYDLSDNTWTQQSPSPKPSPRRDHAMAYMGGDRVLLFGGNDGSSNDETWVYDLSEGTWTQQSPSSQPSARSSHAMAYLSGSRVVLFGGWDGSEDGQTWIYNLTANTWEGDGNYTRPSARYMHGLSETSMDGSSKVVLFGGYDASLEDDETWTFGGGDHLLIAPNIVSIEDVPSDQGRQAALLWQRSLYDEAENHLITYYSIWRKYPDSSVAGMIGDEWDGSVLKDVSRAIFRRLEDGNGSDEIRDDFWEFIGTVDAHFFDNYAYIAPTLEDSSGTGIPYFTFLVSAHTSIPHIFWDSVPASGYSVDNIDPAETQVAIQGFGGSPLESIRLQWAQVTTGVDGSAELGPVRYRIYCDIDAYFAPSPGDLLSTTSMLTYDHYDSRIGDPATNLYYLIVAIDSSDNESVSSNRVGEFDFLSP